MRRLFPLFSLLVLPLATSAQCPQVTAQYQAQPFVDVAGLCQQALAQLRVRETLTMTYVQPPPVPVTTRTISYDAFQAAPVYASPVFLQPSYGYRVNFAAVPVSNGRNFQLGLFNSNSGGGVGGRNVQLGLVNRSGGGGGGRNFQIGLINRN